MRIMVGMSGGVDSAVSAYLLKQQGHDVIGTFMVNWEEKDEEGLCPATEDFEDVMRTCDVIGIPYFSVNFSKEYIDKVFANFLAEFEKGRTPNPDVLCNTEIKLKAFLEFAMSAEYDRIATGHYARISDDGRSVKLLRGADSNKDQTYFLCGLNQEQLKRAIFPVGGMKKAEVKEIARRAGLPVADKKESMGICFIGERNFRQFISKYIPMEPGDIVDADSGKVIGIHRGLMPYTLGQRKGIGIGGMGTGEPWFVSDKDMKNNILYVCQGYGNRALYSKGLAASDFNWIQGEPLSTEFECTAKFRYRQKDAPAHVKVVGEKVFIEFDEPQRAITPGQYAVVYDGEQCLGGGIIETCLKLD